MSSQRWLEPNRRILVIDDNTAIHDDLRKILLGEVKTQENLRDDEELLFGAAPVKVVPATPNPMFSAAAAPAPRAFRRNCVPLVDAMVM